MKNARRGLALAVVLLSAGCNEGALRITERDGAPGQADGGSIRDLGTQDLVGGPKLVFITSKQYSAKLGGLVGADANCQGLAAAAGLAGTFRAWLSDTDSSPQTRFSHSAGPYTLVNGSLVAQTWGELTGAPLAHPIDTNESGLRNANAGTACGGSTVWTDTTNSGVLVSPADTCGEWTDDTGDVAVVGLSSSGDYWSDWCKGGNGLCSMTASLYCFQQ